MSDRAAAPWWAEVQHLRPSDDRSDATPAKRRFDRASGDREAAVATLEHEAPHRFAEDIPEERPTALWDPALEEAFASTPSWADEDDPRLLPKGADRIENGRRTIEIRGQVDGVLGVPIAAAEASIAPRDGRRRPARRPMDRLAGPRPDRVAMWAFLLGVLLILIAAFSKPGTADAAALAAGAERPAAKVLVVSTSDRV